jgi:hypothetical protein
VKIQLLFRQAQMEAMYVLVLSPHNHVNIAAAYLVHHRPLGAWLGHLGQQINGFLRGDTAPGFCQPLVDDVIAPTLPLRRVTG